jgi:dCMP deaminase
LITKYHEILLETAFLFSRLSSCTRRKVGAVLVSQDYRILCCGYNGTISGADNDCEEQVVCPKCKGKSDHNCDCDNGTVLKTKSSVLHAEQNIITYCAKSGTISTNNTILFVTDSPCEHCSKLIVQAGIKQVYYRNLYRCSKGVEFLKKHISVTQI